MTLATTAAPESLASAFRLPTQGAAAPGAAVNGDGAAAVSVTVAPSSSKPAGSNAARGHQQNARQAQAIAAALEALQSVQSQPELAAQMAADGYPAARLAEGLALQAAAQAAYMARQHAIAERARAAAHLQECRTAAKAAYAEFRLCARAVCTSAGDRSDLAVNGELPANTRLLLVQARTSYSAAAQAPYAAALAQTGFGPARVAAAQAGLDALEAALAAVPVANDQARTAVQERNTAADTLRAWMRRFHTVRRVSQRRLAAGRRSSAAQGLPAAHAIDWAAVLA